MHWFHFNSTYMNVLKERLYQNISLIQNHKQTNSIDFYQESTRSNRALVLDEQVIHIIIRYFLLVFTLVHGNWGEWTHYTECSVTCGGGEQSRTRFCSNPSSGHGGNDCLLSGGNGTRGTEETESQSCNEQACPGNQLILCFDSFLSNSISCIGY